MQTPTLDPQAIPAHLDAADLLGIQARQIRDDITGEQRMNDNERQQLRQLAAEWDRRRAADGAIQMAANYLVTGVPELALAALLGYMDRFPAMVLGRGNDYPEPGRVTGEFPQSKPVAWGTDEL